jgi:hypothetical protein
VGAPWHQRPPVRARTARARRCSTVAGRRLVPVRAALALRTFAAMDGVVVRLLTGRSPVVGG